MKTIKDIIRDAEITMTVKPVDSNPNMDDSANMNHWRCTFKNATTGRRMTITFSMGYGHHGSAPDAERVLDCLASDASCADQGFEDWAADLGYDTDSRKAEKTYRVCVRQTERLRSLMGSHFDDLLNAERL